MLESTFVKKCEREQNKSTTLKKNKLNYKHLEELHPLLKCFF